LPVERGATVASNIWPCSHVHGMLCCLCLSHRLIYPGFAYMQVHMIQEIFDAARVTSNPQRALSLVSVLVATWQGRGAEGVMSAHICLPWPRTAPSTLMSEWAIDCLPFSLPSLLSHPEWDPALPQIASSLLLLLDSKSCKGKTRHAVLACLLALRLKLDSTADSHVLGAVYQALGNHDHGAS
jgi:hypothetical protein